MKLKAILVAILTVLFSVSLFAGEEWVYPVKVGDMIKVKSSGLSETTSLNCKEEVISLFCTLCDKNGKELDPGRYTFFIRRPVSIFADTKEEFDYARDIEEQMRNGFFNDKVLLISELGEPEYFRSLTAEKTYYGKREIRVEDKIGIEIRKFVIINKSKK